MNQIYSRRKFIQSALYAGSAVFGAGLLSGGCNPESKSTEKKEIDVPKEEPKAVSQVDQCKDFSGISESDLQKRKQLGYVEKSPIPDSHCSNCALYNPPAAGQDCGGCQLFKGPVYPGAYCTYWAAPQS